MFIFDLQGKLTLLIIEEFDSLKFKSKMKNYAFYYILNKIIFKSYLSINPLTNKNWFWWFKIIRNYPAVNARVAMISYWNIILNSIKMLKLNKNYRNLSTMVYKNQKSDRLHFDPVLPKATTKIIKDEKEEPLQEGDNCFDVIDEIYENERSKCKIMLDSKVDIPKTFRSTRAK